MYKVLAANLGEFQQNPGEDGHWNIPEGADPNDWTQYMLAGKSQELFAPLQESSVMRDVGQKKRGIEKVLSDELNEQLEQEEMGEPPAFKRQRRNTEDEPHQAMTPPRTRGSDRLERKRPTTEQDPTGTVKRLRKKLEFTQSGEAAQSQQQSMESAANAYEEPGSAAEPTQLLAHSKGDRTNSVEECELTAVLAAIPRTPENAPRPIPAYGSTPPLLRTRYRVSETKAPKRSPKKVPRTPHKKQDMRVYATSKSLQALFQDRKTTSLKVSHAEYGKGALYIGNIIGRGGNGTVRSATAKFKGGPEIPLAVKFQNKPGTTLNVERRIMEEFARLPGQDDLALMPQIDIEGDAKSQMLVMPYAWGTVHDLNQPLQSMQQNRKLSPDLKELVVLHLAKDIAFGLLQMQHLNRGRQAVRHADLKAGNVTLFNTDRALICDFGSARSEARITHKIGTPETMAPELLAQLDELKKMADIDPVLRSVTRLEKSKIDVWSLGIIMVELLTGARPINYVDANAKKIRALTTELNNLKQQSKTEEQQLRHAGAATAEILNYQDHMADLIDGKFEQLKLVYGEYYCSRNGLVKQIEDSEEFSTPMKQLLLKILEPNPRLRLSVADLKQELSRLFDELELQFYQHNIGDVEGETEQERQSNAALYTSTLIRECLGKVKRELQEVKLKK